MMEWLLIGFGGSIGAICRFYMINTISRRFSSYIQYGTLAVNILGSFFLGMLFGWGSQNETTWLNPLVGIGILGGFTTFSTYAVEGLHLVQQRQWRVFIIYQLQTYGLTLLSAALGWLIGSVG
jgi:CrcB protein